MQGAIHGGFWRKADGKIRIGSLEKKMTLAIN
jgi:hypothetical protein